MDKIMINSKIVRGIIKKIVKDTMKKKGVDMALDLQSLNIDISDEKGASIDLNAHIELGSDDLWALVILVMKGE